MNNFLNELIAKYEFWRAKKIKIGVHYELHYDESNPKAITFKILKKYPNVIISFDNIEVNEYTNVSFDLTVVSNPGSCDVDSKKFKRFTTDIFRSIMLEAIKNAEETNENGNFDIIEPADERELHEEVSSIFEERVPERKPRKKAVRGNKTVRSKV